MTTLRERFDAVIFDMDGLLLDSERIALVAFNETLASFGLQANDELFNKTVGTNASTCKRILREGLADQIDDPDRFGRNWFNRYIEKTSKEPVPLKLGAEQLLLHLQKINIPVAIATSSKTDLAIKKLENSRIINFFQFVIGGDKVKNGKPDPEIYLEVLKGLSSIPGRTLGLEDSENGVRSAVSAGLIVVQIPDIVHPSESLLRLGHIVLSSLDQVEDYDF